MSSQQSWGDYFFGTPGRFEQVDRFTPQQKQQLEQLLQGVGGAQGQGLDYISRLLSDDASTYADFEAPYKRQFMQETMPAIAERFAGLGSHGAQSSSGMNQAMAQGGRELSENLAALRGQLKQGALGQLQGLMGQAYQPTFENVYQQPTQGFLGGMAGGLGSGLGSLAGLGGLSKLGGLSNYFGGSSQQPQQSSFSSNTGGGNQYNPDLYPPRPFV